MFFQKFATIALYGIIGAALLWWDFKSTGGWHRESPGKGLLGALIVFMFAHYDWMRYDMKVGKRELDAPKWAMYLGPVGFWIWCFSTRGTKGLTNIAITIPLYTFFPSMAYMIYLATKP